MNTTLKNRTPYHSAIPSWSGYNYQGKVALYSSLKFLNQRIGEDFSRFSLELEWYEDFSIKQDGSYLSIHQVKSYKKKNLSEYKDAIWNLLGKTFENRVPEAYLHTSEDIPSLNDITEKLIRLEAPPGDSNEKYTPAYYHKIVTESNCYEQICQNFSKYQYNSGHFFCELEKIDTLIKEQIEDYYKVQSAEKTQGQIKGVFLNLLGCLNKNITIRHASEQNDDVKKQPLVIKFNEITDILENNWEEASEEYFIHLLKNNFHVNSELFIQRLYNNEDMNIEEDLKRVDGYVRIINLLEDNHFLDFCKRITPHITVQKLDIQKFRELIPSNGLKQVFIVTLIQVKQALNDDHLFMKTKSGISEFYLPTTIDTNPADNFEGPEFSVGEIAAQILQNEYIDEFLFEVDVLISKYITTNSIEESAQRINDVPEIDSSVNQERYKKFTKIKNIRMVDINQAMEELD